MVVSRHLSGYYSGKVHPCWTAVFASFLCRVQIYHLDPKARECWGLLGKEQEATTEIL